MAVLTVIAEASVMRIVPPMTGIAVGRKAAGRLGVVDVTARTVHPGMRSGEREVGDEVVIERPGSPGGRIVAAATAIAERALVRVVVSVATVTTGVGIPECGGFVTACTFKFRM